MEDLSYCPECKSINLDEDDIRICGGCERIFHKTCYSRYHPKNIQVYYCAECGQEFYNEPDFNGSCCVCKIC